MKRALALLAALLLVALPVAAQTPAPRPPEGTVGVFVYRVTNGEPVQVGDPVVVLPPAGPVCLPEGAS